MQTFSLYQRHSMKCLLLTTQVDPQVEWNSGINATISKRRIYEKLESDQAIAVNFLYSAVNPSGESIFSFGKTYLCHSKIDLRLTQTACSRFGTSRLAAWFKLNRSHIWRRPIWLSILWRKCSKQVFISCCSSISTTFIALCKCVIW